MPIYEFTCGKCEKDSELLVRSSKWEGTVKCPHCGSPKLSKKLSVFASSTAAGTSSQVTACGMSPKQAGCGCSCAGGKHRH